MFRWFFIFAFMLTLNFSAESAWSVSIPVLLKNKTELEILFGRLCVLPAEGREGNMNIDTLGANRVQFQLTHGTGGTANVHFFLFSKNELGWLECENGLTLHELWWNRKENTYIRYTQENGNLPIHLEVGTVPEAMQEEILKNAKQNNVDFENFHGENVQEFHGMSVWSLLFFRTPECSQALSAIVLKHTGKNKFLQDVQSRFFDALIQCHEPESGAEFSVQKIHDLIPLLGADDFNVRRQADTELREAGAAVLFALNDVSIEKLSPEAQVRLKQILSSMDFNLKEDSLPFYAHSWYENPAVWVAVLENGTPEQRADAWKIFQKFYTKHPEWPSVAYDPAKDPETQKDGIQTLKNLTYKEVQ